MAVYPRTQLRNSRGGATTRASEMRVGDCWQVTRRLQHKRASRVLDRGIPCGLS